MPHWLRCGCSPGDKLLASGFLGVSDCGTLRLPRECGVPPDNCRAGTQKHVLGRDPWALPPDRSEVATLDEATTGLDPASRAQAHQITRSLAAGGATVLLTTQYLDEADQLAARIAVIDHGTVMAGGTPGQLKAAAGSGTLRIRLADPAQRPLARRTLAGLLSTQVQEGADPVVLTATVPAIHSGRLASEQAVAAVSGLGRAGITVGEFALGQPSLNEVFLALTGQPTASSAPAAAGLKTTAAGTQATMKGAS